MAEHTSKYRLTGNQLYRACDTSQFRFETTADLEALGTAVGQERALDAIAFGVDMAHDGFNLYVMGSTGLGRHTFVREALEERAGLAPPPFDWCYVANYQQPHTPVVLKLPAGMGRRLRQDMKQLIEDLLSAIPAAFQGDEYRRRANEITEEFKKREDDAARELGEMASSLNIALMRGATGFTLSPQKDGKVLSHESFRKLPEKEQERFEASMEAVKQKLKETMSQVPEWQREIRKRMRALDQETMAMTVERFLAELEEQYADYPDVMTYLAAVKADIIENVDQFRMSDLEEEQRALAGNPAFNRYQVNILVDNSDTEAAPIVYENNPTYQNLIGRIEHMASMGTLYTDFTLIKAGALHQANGGYLILDVEKILSTPFSWEGLKRALNAREIRVEGIERQLSLASTISLEPEPIPLDIKVVLVGSRQLYHLLNAYDPEFGLLFKVPADFSEEMPRGDESEMAYARLIATLQQQEALRPIDQKGVALVIEHSARETWRADKLSLHISSLLDLLRSADHYADREKRTVISAEDIETAIAKRRERSSQIEEQLQEEILKNTLQIDTEGMQLARVNGLTVLQTGDYAFGIPCRISATARLGAGEVVDIERESEQGGAIHSKGVMILTSYLASRYAKHVPLSLSASLVFEQTYGHVEGDSASAAELCALLSALAEVPIDQSLAITGSINQHGQVQAIGGVCEKIEGFFDLCNARGLTGEQGVIIPRSNLRHLMLNKPVREAVEAGRFHIHAVDHVEHAMELFTGLPAGSPDSEGLYPEGTMNYMIQLRLSEWITLRQHFAGQTPVQTS
ncbi:MAG: AAA family ATPase [Chromatiales bacterium]